jgi:thiol:disulfide interchange protein DsbD
MIIGVGMSVPYLFLTSIPGLINKMPKPGGWMEKIKIITGFILLAVAVKLLTALSPDFRKNVLYYSVLLAFCVWVWGTWITLSTSPSKKWLIRVFVLLTAVGGGWAILPVEKDLIDWQSYDRSEINYLLENNEPVLIKFTAEWCTNCTIVKKRVYEKPKIADLIERKNVTAFIGDTTLEGYEATRDLYGVYREPGVPVSIIHKPGGEVIKLRGIIDAEDLEEVVKDIGEDVKD